MHIIKCTNVIAVSINGVQQLKLPSEGQTGPLALLTACPLLIFNSLYLNHATRLTVHYVFNKLGAQKEKCFHRNNVQYYQHTGANGKKRLTFMF